MGTRRLLLEASQALQPRKACNWTWCSRYAFTSPHIDACMAGEPWSLMGTRRLLLEASQGSAATQGLQLELVQQVCVHTTTH